MSEIFRVGVRSKCLLLSVVLGSILVVRPAWANVYATSVKINGSITNVTTETGAGVSLSFILNEDATAGVTINVLSGTNVLRAIALNAGDPGTTRGLNTVLWDGKDNASNNVPPGTYAISITAASSHSDWTQLTIDWPAGPNTYVSKGTGIAVDQNPASPYYGRVFVANSDVGPNPATTPGDVVGVLKFNADASTPEDGIVSTMDHAWAGGGLGPRKVAVSQDDRVYVSDLGHNGELYSWDPAFSTNSYIAVLSVGNQPAGGRLNGLALARQGTNTQVWMSDNLSNNGILKWILGLDGACVPGDMGTGVVGFGETNTGLSLPCEDVAVDNAGNIYTCQAVTNSSDPTPRVFRFPAYDPSTNGFVPEAIADWAVGSTNDDYGGAAGIAVDPTGTYVAVSFGGIVTNIFPTLGNTKIFYTTNGALAANIDLNLAIQGDYSHQDTACAWDAVGNLYYIDYYWGVWRAVSPPGTNHSTTVALAAVQVVAPPAEPVITGITLSNGIVTISFTASPADTTNSFVVLTAASVLGPFSEAPNATIVQIGPGQFNASLAQSAGSAQYYKVQRVSSRPQAPNITGLSVAAGSVTITFQGATTDLPSAFTLLSAATPAGTFSTTAGASITGSNGNFSATAPTNGAMQFYRIQR